MITNGGFADGTGWTVGASWAIGSGVVTYTCCGASNTCQKESAMTHVLEVSTNYRLTFDLTSSAPGIYLTIGSCDDNNCGVKEELVSGTNYTTGAITLDFTTPGTLTGTGLTIRAFGDANGTIDNISLKKR
jgi:hypothetical protein